MATGQIISDLGYTQTRMIQESDRTVINTISDHTGLMEQNKRARNSRSNFNPGEDHTLAAVIPIELLQHFANSRGISMHEAMNDDSIIAQCIAANPDCKTIDKWVF